MRGGGVSSDRQRSTGPGDTTLAVNAGHVIEAGAEAPGEGATEADDHGGPGDEEEQRSLHEVGWVEWMPDWEGGNSLELGHWWDMWLLKAL